MMKKITLFLMLLTVTFSYSQTLPFDFEGTLHGFIGDSGASVSAKDDSGNQVLEIVGNGTDWDNAQVTFASVLDLSVSNENTIKFRMKAPGSAAGAVHEHNLKFEKASAGGDLEVRFTTTGPDWQDIEVDMDNGNTTPTSYGKMVIMVDVGQGATASAVATYLVDDISIGQTTTGTDASLSDLTVDGSTITGFDATTTSYTVEVAKGATEVPTVTATATDSGATAVVTPATSLPGNTTVEVTAPNGTTTKVYTVSFKYPITFPFDFEGASTNWIGDNSTVSLSGNGELEIIGNGTDWDNAQVTFTSPVDLSDNDNNTLRFTIQSTTAADGEVHQHGISFQDTANGAGGNYEVNFQTTGKEVANIELDFEAGLGTSKKFVIFTDVGDLANGAGKATPNVKGLQDAGKKSGTYILDNITLGATVIAGSDATLSDLTVSGSSISGFDANTLNYTVEVAEGATEVPTVTATATDSGATAVVTAATSLPGDTTVEVTAADGTTKKVYTVSFKYPVTFPFDFEGSSTNWIGDNSTVSISANGELEIVGNGTDWDNAQVIFTSPVDLSDDDNNTLRFTFQSTTAADGEVRQHGISFQDTANGAEGSYEANFQTTGKEVANIELDFEAGLGTSKKFVIFTDVGDLGAIKATPNVNGLADAGKKSGTYIVDNITLGATVLNIKNNSVLDFSMYPNPTSNMLNISAKETIQDTQIFNVLGKNVMSVKVNNRKASIDVSNLATGIYLVKYSVNGTIGTAKFVKQ